MSSYPIQIIDFLRSVNTPSRENFVASHGMTFQHLCPGSTNIANGPRAIGPVSDGYPQRLLGGADSLGVGFKDTEPVLSQKEVRIVNFSRTPAFDHPLEKIRL